MGIYTSGVSFRGGPSWQRRMRAAILMGAMQATVSGWVLGEEGVSQVQAQAPVAQGVERKGVPTEPKIQLAILLDTSSSMDGLINQARAQLWKVVNEFAKSKRNGKQPVLEVALFEYGNDGLPPQEGYIRLVVPFTTDLDKMSQELFALKTNGGSEFCGQTIMKATTTLAWSKDSGDLKCIFIAGNEAFTQGPVDYKLACKKAADGGITVSTIHCGDFQTGLQSGWADGAKLADGSYMSIDANKSVAEIPTPHDQKLADLSSQLNTTYLAYGSSTKREAFAANQVAQDANALGAGLSVAAGRAASKVSGNYRTEEWDLVEGIKNGKVKLDAMKEEEFPDDLKKLKPEERLAWVEKKSAERAALQEEIKKLTASRESFLADARAKLADKDKGDTLDAAIIKATRQQAEKKNYKFE